jgi:hypothetical protein
VDREKQRKRSNSLFSTGELVHITKALHWRHGVEGYATEIWLLAVFQVEIRNATHRGCFAFCKVLVNAVYTLSNVIECLSEKLRAK